MSYQIDITTPATPSTTSADSHSDQYRHTTPQARQSMIPLRDYEYPHFLKATSNLQRVEFRL